MHMTRADSPGMEEESNQSLVINPSLMVAPVAFVRTVLAVKCEDLPRPVPPLIFI